MKLSEKRQPLEKFTSPVGSAVYPHLVRPDTKFDSDGVFRVTLALDAGAAKPFIAQLEAARDRFTATFAKDEPVKAKKASIADVYEDELDESGEETGRVLIKAKQKAKVTVGDKVYEKSVKLFDSQNQIITPDSMWSGTKLKLAGVLVPYYMASSKEIGVSLRLAAAQVIELVQGDGGSGESFGFGSEDGGYVAETFENSASPETAGGDDTDGDGDDF